MTAIRGELHPTREWVTLLPEFVISTDTDWTYTPFLTKDGQVGVMLRDGQGREEFLYFNPSGEGDPENANVFVYSGKDVDLDTDEAGHFYAMGREWA